MSKKYVIGIDIGGTNFRIGAVDENGTAVLFRKIPVASVFCTEEILEDLKTYLFGYLEELKKAGIVPCGMAIGFPATLDRERTTVLQAPNVAFMENLPVKAVLSEAFDFPVWIERDVSMALYYDKRGMDLENSEVIAGCYFGTGVGNAIIVHGIPLLGRNGTAGELGHIPVDGSEVPCGCGLKGCLENLAGGKYLAKLCREIFTETEVGDLFAVHGNDPLLVRFVDRMAAAVATEINILNPDCMIVSGGVPAMKDFPTEKFLAKIKEHTRKPYPAEDLRVCITPDFEDKCVIGSAFYALEMIVQKKGTRDDHN